MLAMPGSDYDVDTSICSIDDETLVARLISKGGFNLGRRLSDVLPGF